MTAHTPLRCFVLTKNRFRALIYEENIATNLLYGLASYLREF